MKNSINKMYFDNIISDFRTFLENNYNYDVDDINTILNILRDVLRETSTRLLDFKEFQKSVLEYFKSSMEFNGFDESCVNDISTQNKLLELINGSRTGKIYLIIGPMFSGKSSELVNIYKRKKIAGLRCAFIKYARDTRYDKNIDDNEKMITHDDIKVNALSCNNLFDLKLNHADYDIIFIDEIQFYPDKIKFCEDMADFGLDIYASGLSSNYLRESFPEMDKLYAIAYNIKMFTAVCDICKTDNSACYTKRFSDSKELILIGEHDVYKTVCRKCYFEK